MDVSHVTVALIMCACHKRCDTGFDSAVSSMPLEIDSDRLQIIPSPGKSDHRPKSVRFEQELTYTATAASPKWDQMRLVQGVLQGHGRESFLAAV